MNGVHVYQARDNDPMFIHVWIRGVRIADFARDLHEELKKTHGPDPVDGVWRNRNGYRFTGMLRYRRDIYYCGTASGDAEGLWNAVMIVLNSWPSRGLKQDLEPTVVSAALKVFEEYGLQVAWSGWFDDHRNGLNIVWEDTMPVK